MYLSKAIGMIKITVILVIGYVSYPLMTLIFGNGVLWSYVQSRLQHEQFNLDKIVKTASLREKQNDILLKILQNTGKSIEFYQNFKETGDWQLEQEARRTRVYVDSLREEFRKLEKDLAQLE
jgi:DNA-binding response OmpR family regulator